MESNHTVGAHSDDRGGASDAPCYCDQKGANEKLGLPRNKMIGYYIAFDVDGTLRDNKVRQSIAPIANEDIRNLLIILRRSFKNVKIIVWSGSGELYARQVAASFGIHSYVNKYMAKEQYEEFRKGRNIIAIDDIQDTALGNVANLIVRMK